MKWAEKGKSQAAAVQGHSGGFLDSEAGTTKGDDVTPEKQGKEEGKSQVAAAQGTVEDAWTPKQQQVEMMWSRGVDKRKKERVKLKLQRGETREGRRKEPRTPGLRSSSKCR